MSAFEIYDIKKEQEKTLLKGKLNIICRPVGFADWFVEFQTSHQKSYKNKLVMKTPRHEGMIVARFEAPVIFETAYSFTRMGSDTKLMNPLTNAHLFETVLQSGLRPRKQVSG